MRLREIVDVADQIVGSGFSSIELRNKAKLKRQLAEQAEELEIVKKAATYFVYGIHGFYKIRICNG